MTPTLATFDTTITSGNIAAIHRPARTDHRGEVVVGLGEPLGLVGLADERTDHPDAGDLLAEHPVDVVEPLLDEPERRDHVGDDDADADEQHGHDHDDQPGEPEVLPHRHHDAADHHDRDGHRHQAGHHRQHLHLLDVVRRAGDQRGCAVRRDLAAREAADPLEHGGPQVAAARHRGLAAEPRRRHRAGRLEQGDREHDRAEPDDVAGVALGDAVVDDVGVEAGQVEHRDGRRELQDHDRRQPAAVRREVLAQESAQHQILLSSSA